MRRTESSVARRTHQYILPRSEWAQDRIKTFLDERVDPSIYDYKLNEHFKAKSWKYKFTK
jgi:hypothetical protein